MAIGFDSVVTLSPQSWFSPKIKRPLEMSGPLGLSYYNYVSLWHTMESAQSMADNNNTYTRSSTLGWMYARLSRFWLSFSSSASSTELTSATYLMSQWMSN